MYKIFNLIKISYLHEWLMTLQSTCYLNQGQTKTCSTKMYKMGFHNSPSKRSISLLNLMNCLNGSMIYTSVYLNMKLHVMHKRTQLVFETAKQPTTIQRTWDSFPFLFEHVLLFHYNMHCQIKFHQSANLRYTNSHRFQYQFFHHFLINQTEK